MNQFLSIISDIRVVIGIAIIVLILVVWLIVEKVRTNRYRKELESLEERYNQLKGVPLSFKMNKAVSVSKVNEATSKKADQAQKSYDNVQSAIHRISDNLAECEDSILVGKLRKADDLMQDLEADLSLTDKEVKDLDLLLDDILSRETAHRQEVTNLKNRFRALKSLAQENAAKLSVAYPAIEQNIADTEKMFSTFEEWMYSSDYDRANAELDLIQASMKNLENGIDHLPALLEDARGVVPNMAETLQRDYSRAKNRGVYVKHLDVEKNLTVLSNSLKEDLKKLKAGKMDGVAENLEVYKERIAQMDEQVKNESAAYDEMKVLSKETDALFDTTFENEEFVRTALKETSVKFGLEGMDETLVSDSEELKRLSDMRPRVIDNVRNFQIPASTVMVSLKELNQDLTRCNDSLRDMRSRIEVASGDEDRAKKQLVKLQIIMNQMQVKIRKYKLPNISDTYEEDMHKASDYISSLQEMMNHNPINMQLLTSTLQEALDFIYKLYNNVNNVVGTVVMVENTIVFGNRYRSTYADIDSELTRSELCFRNGEYTQALTIAIATIEKIHPGNYESMIKENSKGAE